MKVRWHLVRRMNAACSLPLCRRHAPVSWPVWCLASAGRLAVVMIAGNQPVIPESLLSGVRTLTANIVLEMGYAADLHREALIATAVVLFVFILIINLTFSLLKRRGY